MLNEVAYFLDPVLFAKNVLGFPADEVQERILRSEAKRLMIVCHRQWGKTTSTALKALHTALYNPESLILIIARAERQARELLLKIHQLGLRISGVGFISESKTHLELFNNTRVISLPSSSSSIRGYSNPDFVICDEASRIEDEVYVALLPMLLHGGSLWMLSTPAGRRGYFYESWTHQESYEKYFVPITENPRITKEQIDREQGSMSDRAFRQEHLCEFLDIEGAAIATEYFERALDPEVKPLFQDRQDGFVVDSDVKPLEVGE